MERIAQREAFVLLAALIIFMGLLYPALLHARREARDGIRRNEVAAFKKLLEQYYNEHETYPLKFSAAPHEYIVTSSTSIGVTAWYLRAQLENSHGSQAGHDEDEGRKYDFRLIREGESTYYEVCGGTPTCGLGDPR